MDMVSAGNIADSNELTTQVNFEKLHFLDNANTSGYNTSWNNSVSETKLGIQLSLSVPEATIYVIGTLVCITTTIIGNILVILSVFTYRPLRNVQNFFIVSLAVADMAVSILVMPFSVVNYCVGHWIFGIIFCDVWLTCDILTCTASILNLCAIALDRYWAIHDPINYATKRTLKRVLLSIAIVWGASALISIPPLIGWNNASGHLLDETSNICALTDEKSFVVYSALGSFYVPLFIMTFVYVKIFIATKRRLRERAQCAAAAKLASATGKDSSNKYTNIEASSSDSPEETVDQGQSEASSNSVKKPHKKLSTYESSKANNNAKSQISRFLEERQRISLSKERRAARTLGIIMGVFVLCWLPFFLMYIIFPFCKFCTQNTDIRVVNFITWLGYINSGLNPIIYTVFNIDFRRAFRRLLFGGRHR